MGPCMEQTAAPKLLCRRRGLDVQLLLFRHFNDVNSVILEVSEPLRGPILGISIIPKVSKNLCAVRLEMLSFGSESERHRPLTPARTLVMSSTRIPDSGNVLTSLPSPTEAKNLR